MSTSEADVVEGETTALVPTAGRELMRAPDVVLAEAQRAARALKDVIDKKPHKVIMGGEAYLQFEDWQTVGRFYGITAKEDGDPEYVEFGGVTGFKASAVALDAQGEVRSRATAYCLSDEEKWSARPSYKWCYVTRDGQRVEEDPGPDRIVWEPNPAKPGKNKPKKERVLMGEEKVPLFQMASMAQTRANAKVLRNVLAWVVVLAGYRPTPSEELDLPPQPPPDPPPTNGDPPPAAAATPPSAGKVKFATQIQRDLIKKCAARAGVSDEQLASYLGGEYGIETLIELPQAHVNATIKWCEAQEAPA